MPISTSISMIDTPLMRGLEHALDQGAFRHQLIAANLANVDTPGYRTRDLRPFAGELQQAIAGQEINFAPMSRPLSGLIERPDGNNVNVDRESLLLAENQLHFQVAVQFLRAEFHRLSLAIHEGVTS
jgi:flagellar basal-body rod protein FlgB